MLWRLLRGLLRLLGFPLPEPQARPEPAGRDWHEALSTYRLAQAQVRDAASPEALEVAHANYMAAEADLTWRIRMSKQERGLPLRSPAETRRIHQAMLHQFGYPPTVHRTTLKRTRRGARRRGSQRH